MGADLYNPGYAEIEPFKSLKQKSDALYKKMHALRDHPEPVTEAARTEWLDAYNKVMDNPFYYFRESYGGSGLLNLMGLSWWQDVIPLQDITPPDNLTDEEFEKWYEENPINMSPEACQQFIDLLQANRAIVDAYPEDEWEEGTDWLTHEPYRTNVGEWYRNRFNQLIEFLRKGVETGGIYASL